MPPVLPPACPMAHCQQQRRRGQLHRLVQVQPLQHAMGRALGTSKKQRRKRQQKRRQTKQRHQTRQQTALRLPRE